jgi:hypothetical protein
METKTLGEKLEEIRQLLLNAKRAHFQDIVKTVANTFE